MHWPTILNPNRIAEFIRGTEQPSLSASPDIELLNKRHEECSKNLRNSVLTFAGFAVICWAALSKQDIDLLSVQSTVKIGVVGIEVKLDNFLAVAPLTALLLLIHGAVFRLRLNRLDPVVAELAKISTLFNLPGRLAQLAAFFLHVLVPVALLVFLLAKTSNRESFQSNLPIIAAALIVVVAANLRFAAEANARFGRFNGATITVTLCIAIGLIAAAINPPLGTILREQIMCRAPLDYREVVFGKAVDLRGGRFHCAKFFKANLTGANLTGADLTRAILTGADLTRGILTNADLTNADLTNADLTNAELPYASLTGANLKGANLTGAKLWGATLTSANLRGANLTSAKLTGAKLTGAILAGADLRGADLARAKLTGAILAGAYLRGASLTGAILADADLRDADLADADLRGAFLTDANLTGANLTGANLWGATLTSANLRGASLTDADNLTQEQLDSACISEGGKPPTLPEGLKPPQNECAP